MGHHFTMNIMKDTPFELMSIDLLSGTISVAPQPHQTAWTYIWSAVLFLNDENVNLAKQLEMQSLVKELCQILQAGLRSALPPLHNRMFIS